MTRQLTKGTVYLGLWLQRDKKSLTVIVGRHGGWSSKLRVHVLNCKPKAERQREQEQEHWDWNKAFYHKATYSIRPSPTPLHSGTYRIVSSTGEQVFKWPRLQETFVIRTITFWSIYSNVLPIWNVQCYENFFIDLETGCLHCFGHTHMIVSGPWY